MNHAPPPFSAELPMKVQLVNVGLLSGVPFHIPPPRGATLPMNMQLVIDGELPCSKVFENERILAIKDTMPAAPVHILIMPKKEIPSFQDIKEEDLKLISEIVTVAQKLAKEFKIEDGYRFLVNNGKDAGQTIYHLHFHLIGGKCLGAMG